MDLNIKRVYEPPSGDDGLRVLVDRLWPRGLSKAEAEVDVWLKTASPSPELRKWFNHDPAKWPDFQKKYLQELEGSAEALEQLKELARKPGQITLLYAAKDERHNNAVVLRDFLLRGH